MFDAHFFSALNLHDLRVVDDNFHRPEAQILKRLKNGLFYATVEVIVLHVDPSLSCLDYNFKIAFAMSESCNSYNSGRHNVTQQYIN